MTNTRSSAEQSRGRSADDADAVGASEQWSSGGGGEAEDRDRSTGTDQTNKKLLKRNP